MAAEETITDWISMNISFAEGDCSLATALAAGRLMLNSAPLLSVCKVSVLADSGIFSVILKLREDGSISEVYEATKHKQQIISPGG